MAQVEPMDIDAIESDFDNKENTFHHSNVLSRTPCTEKGYEEVDVSELNMKLRYSVTPASSPMSKSLTGPFLDNRTNTIDDCVKNIENSNLTRSLSSTLTKPENTTKSKVLPLQTLSADPFIDSNRNSSIRRLIDPNVIISVNTNDIDDNLSLPSTSSSVAATPEATTPTKDIPKPEGSPILRGLKSVLSMFRPSQSPIPPDDKTPKQDILSPVESQILTPHKNGSEPQTVLVSTPLASERQKEGSSSRRSSPLKESVIFNDDLERQLQWKDETTIIFKHEKIPVHKLFFRNPLPSESVTTPALKGNVVDQNTTVEFMDISHNEPIVTDTVVADIVPNIISTKIEEAGVVESDNEFLDCETTFSKNESYTTDFILEKETKTQIISNVPVDSTEKVLTPEIEDSKFNPDINITDCMHPEYVYVEPSKTPSIVDFNNRNSNTSKIIEDTMQFLKNETFDHSSGLVLKSTSTLSRNHIVNLQIENQIISHDCDATRDMGDEVISNDVKSLDVIETNVNVAESIIEDLCMKEGQEKSINLKIEESESAFEGELSEINNLPDRCPVTLSHIGCPEDTLSKITDKIKLDEYTDQILVNSKADFKNDNVNVMVKPDSCDDASLKAELVDTILLVSNSQERSKPDELEDTQVDNVIPVNSNVLIECVHSSYENVTNMHATVDYNAKDADMSLTEYTKNDNDVLLNVTCGIGSISSIIHLKSEPEGLEGSFSQKIKLNEPLEKDDKPISDIASNATFDNILSVDNDRDISEMTVTSNMAVIKPPSEIPLPVEDDTEQNIKEKKNIIANISLTLDKECDESSTVNETASAGNLQSGHVMSTENSEKEVNKTLSINVIDENSTEIVVPVDKLDSSELHKYSTENQCGLVQETKSGITKDDVTDIRTSNLTHSDVHDVCEEAAPKEVDNKNIFRVKVSNNTSAVENKDITNNILNKSNIKSLENISTEKSLESETANGVQKIAEINGVIVDKDTDQGNELRNSVEEVDEEIITSANNSPYVSVAELALDIQPNSELTVPGSQDILQDIDNPLVLKTKIASSPPISPKIVSKGYNYNFDDIDDPFTTKTKIRISPTPNVPDQACGNSSKEFKKPEKVSNKISNRRKSQPERKNVNQKKNFNSTFSGESSYKENETKKNIMKQNLSKPRDKTLVDSYLPFETQHISETKLANSVTVIGEKFNANSQGADEDVDDFCESDTLCPNLTPVSIQQEEIVPTDTESKGLDQTIVVSVEKSTSSSEQYFSLGTSSAESVGCMNHSKNVFNLPEIDDMNFNPFSTKSKMRMSPPPIHNTTNVIEDEICDTVSTFTLEQEIDNNIAITKDVDVGDDSTFNKITATDCSQNICSANCSSKSTNDKDDTVREILTEDDDTIEGPFLDDEDLKNIEKLTHLEVENDMMNFDEVHSQEKDPNSENGELFIDAEAFEFLLNQKLSLQIL